MSLLQIALKNVRYRALSYAAFFLGSSFAVWMLFLYSWLLAHPAIATLGNTGTFLRMTQVVTAIFSVFFIVQAQGSFVRARQKELGTLTMLGLLPKQLRALVRWENLIIGAGATVFGIVGGNLWARLFGLTFTAILGTGVDLPYYFSWTATLICLAVFPLVMTGASVLGHRRLQGLPLAEILSGSARPKAPPQSSPWLAMLCAVLLGGTYLSLLLLNDQALSVPALLVATLVSTYLFFSQGGVALLAWLRQNRAIMWKPDALFVISQMAYKLKDNVGTLFLTSLMTTFVVALSAFNYSVHFAGAFGLSPTISYNAQTANFRIVLISFITLLFFLGAGNVLYFKLFTDLQEDRRQFQALHKLGLGPNNIRRIISVQTAVIFFLPGFLAAVNALVIQVRIVPNVGLVAFPVLAGVLLIYGVLQGAYFMVTRRIYFRRLMDGI